MNLILPAEWAEQAFVQIAWPHAATDWQPYLDAAWQCYADIAREISKREDLVIVTPEPEVVEEKLKSLSDIQLQRIHLLKVETNDTWARDHAFLTMTDEAGNKTLADFTFNGWGLKFAANLDNRINRQAFSSLKQLLDGKVSYADALHIVLEGGSVESDGKGTVLTTTSCLLAPNRNNFASKEEAESALRNALHCNRILWLDNSWLDGDDTDGHIDTVARFCPNDTIAYVQCTDKEDEHFTCLNNMEKELQQLRTAEGSAYRLIPLPMPDAIFEGDFEDAVAGEEGQRLPATYANFLIMNGAVLMPTYGQPENDRLAASQLQKAFPDREIVGIDCRVLIRQHGSLHCVTMQYPK
jgi:agmatine/peptidylarginine deiminase